VAQAAQVLQISEQGTDEIWNDVAGESAPFLKGWDPRNDHNGTLMGPVESSGVRLEVSEELLEQTHVVVRQTFQEVEMGLHARDGHGHG
jgi:hypothetical protein